MENTMGMLPRWYTTTYDKKDACVRWNRVNKLKLTTTGDIGGDKAKAHAYSKEGMAKHAKAYGYDPERPTTLHDRPPPFDPAKPLFKGWREYKRKYGCVTDERPSDRPAPAPCSDQIPGSCFKKGGRRER